jgi:hypothetical protein
MSVGIAVPRRRKGPPAGARDEPKTVTVEFAPEVGVTGTLTLTQDQLLALINDLGRVHEQLTREKPPPQLWGKRIDCVFNARWQILPEPLSEGSVIAFYHPGFGPVGFVIPRDQVDEIVRTLSYHLELPPPPRRPRN